MRQRNFCVWRCAVTVNTVLNVVNVESVCLILRRLAIIQRLAARQGRAADTIAEADIAKAVKGCGGIVIVCFISDSVKRRLQPRDFSRLRSAFLLYRGQAALSRSVRWG